MTVQRVADMTLETLREFAAEVVNQQLNSRQPSKKDERSLQEVLAAMDQIRWFPPSNSPTTLELLREDRDC